LEISFLIVVGEFFLGRQHCKKVNPSLWCFSERIPCGGVVEDVDKTKALIAGGVEREDGRRGRRGARGGTYARCRRSNPSKT
jgi:hypothetical protein